MSDNDDTMDDAIGDPARVALQQRLAEVTQEHRDLDTAIARLTADPAQDELQLRRLKRRKLLLKDQITRLLRQMDKYGAVAATPVMPAGTEPAEDDIFDFSSGYLARGKHQMPRNAATLPWRLNQDYTKDRTDMRRAPIDDGVLEFQRRRELVGG